MNKIEAMKAMLDGHKVTQEGCSPYYYLDLETLSFKFNSASSATMEHSIIVADNPKLFFENLGDSGWEIYEPSTVVTPEPAKDIIKSADELKQRVREAVEAKKKTLVLTDRSERMFAFSGKKLRVIVDGMASSVIVDALLGFDLFPDFELEVVSDGSV